MTSTTRPPTRERTEPISPSPRVSVQSILNQALMSQKRPILAHTAAAGRSTSMDILMTA
jgi:hypothetical protein